MPVKNILRKEYAPFNKVTDTERITMVRDIFSTITGKYDFLNHFLSLRRDVAWRRLTCRKMVFTATARLLDVATGTADLAIEAVRHHPDVAVIGIDFSSEMLDVGRRKIVRRGLTEKIALIEGDAMGLPFPDGSFDAAVVGFGIRNMPDRIRALSEMRRVVVPGGQVMVLEMTTPRGPFFRGIYSFYLRKVLPRMARLFSRNPAAYEYLADSIMNFPSPDGLASLMSEAGLRDVVVHRLTGGITCLHIGRKPEDTGAE